MTALIAQQSNHDKADKRTIAKKIFLEKLVLADTTYLVDSILGRHWIEPSGEWDIQPFSRSLYTYNEHGDPEQYDYSQWNSVSNIWIIQYQYQYQYDGLGNLTEFLMNELNPTSGTLVPYERDTLWYNNSNICVLEKMYFFDSINQTWFLGFSWRYNDAGGLLEAYDYFWNTETFKIENGYRSNYLLNNYNRPVEMLMETMDTATGSWSNYSRSLSEYADDTVQLKNTDYQWDSSQWVLTGQALYSYTGSLLTDFTYQIWHDGSWINNYRNLYTYNESNYETEYLSQTWMFPGWKTGYQRLKIYDDDGKKTENIIYNFSINTGDTTKGVRYLYTYTNNGLLDYVVYQLFSQTIHGWRNNTKSNYFYSPFIGMEELSQVSESCTFSNPYHPGDFIFCSTLDPGRKYNLALYSVSGACVYRKAFQGDNGITVDRQLPDGLYLMIISDQKGVISKNKLVVKN